MNIFLIGYRGTGKTTVGRLLAEKMGWSFMDLDLEVTAVLNMTISEIVETHGWEAFRKMERTAVKHACACERHVVATGGGAVVDSKNIEDMKKSGILIWLKATPETIKARLTGDRKTRSLRPSLTHENALDEIEAMLQRRQASYEAAHHFCVETDSQPAVDVCRIILEKLMTFESSNLF